MMANPDQPLRGRTIIITRARHQAAELCAPLEAAGASVISCPAIRIAPPDDPVPLQRAIRQLQSYDWLVFTSVNGVAGFFDAIERAALSRSVLAGVAVACVGPATAEALRHRGVEPDAMPGEFVGARIASMLTASGPPRRVLLARAREADRSWPAELRAAGVQVDDIEVYRTVADAEMLAGARALIESGLPDLVLFTSPSAATFFAEAAGPALAKVPLAAIGPVTAARIRQLGYEPAVIAREYTTSGLVAAVGAYFASR